MTVTNRSLAGHTSSFGRSSVWCAHRVHSHNGAGRAFIDHRVPASGDEGAEIVAAEADRRSSRSVLVPLSSTTTHKDSKVRLIIPGDGRADQPISILSTLGSALLGFSPANRSTALTMQVRITG